MTKLTLIKVLTASVVVNFGCMKEKESTEDIAFFRDKIINQRLMLDDALKQLEYEKTQVNLLKKQVEINQQTSQQPQNVRETVVLASNKMIEPKEKPESQADNEDYERLKAEVSLWQSRANKKEEKYLQAKEQLKDVLELLSKNKIEQVKNKFGILEKLILPILPASPSPEIANSKKNTPNTGIADNNGVAITQMYDSLMLVLSSERGLSKDKVGNLERMLSNSMKEVNRWKRRFNQNGVYIGDDYHSNFSVNLTADSSQNNKIAFTVVVSRESAKLKHTDISVSVACKLPNGNLVNTYTGKLEYEKNAPHANIKNIQPFAVETAGWHEVIVYVNNKEAYYEDMFFSKK
jgi:hypothetical protein